MATLFAVSSLNFACSSNTMAGEVASASFTNVSASTDSCYGVCAHVTNWEFAGRGRTFDMARIAGIDVIRSDFLWSECQKELRGSFDFSRYDKVVDEAAASGIEILPILFSPPKWAKPIYRHLAEWSAYVEAVVRHFRGRIRSVEIWNEQNIAAFWGESPNPTNYLSVLSTAYKTVNRVDPSVRVLFGGTSTIPFDYIREMYRLGGADYFDVMNVHPYCRWFAPEGLLDIDLEKLHALMEEFGDRQKPIVITEQGWATHSVGVDGEDLRAGLAVACPEKKSWNIVFAATAADANGRPLPDIAAALEEALPPSSRAEVCLGAQLRARLALGDVDAVLYPFDESFPIDTADMVFEFVKDGGTLVCLRGIPMYYAFRETSPGVFSLDEGSSNDWLRRRLRISESAWWIDKNLPESGFAFPTDAARAVGFRCDPAGVAVNRFQTPKLLKPGDEWIPLLTLKDKSGCDAVAAGVVRFNSDLKGKIVVFGTAGRGLGGTIDELTQAKYLVRSLAISLAEGVETSFWYEFRADEKSNTYSEQHYGLLHANFSPKPAYGAYMNFVVQRPKGSIQSSRPWHDRGRKLYFPQWTRPDGTSAGVIWRKGLAERVTCSFDSANMHFTDYTGKTICPAQSMPGVYRLRISESPVFFSGGRLVGQIEKSNKERKNP